MREILKNKNKLFSPKTIVFLSKFWSLLLFLILFLSRAICRVFQSPFLFYGVIEAAGRTKFGKKHNVKVWKFSLSILIFALCFLFVIVSVAEYVGNKAYSSVKKKIEAEWDFRQRVVLKAEEIASCRPIYRMDGQVCGNCYDCSGFVTEVFKRLDKETRKPGASKGVEQIYNFLGKNISFRWPEVGDIVFLEKTTKESLNSDELTHCGIVETVFDDGSFMMVHMSDVGKNFQRTHYSLTRNYIDGFGQIRGFGFINLEGE